VDDPLAAAGADMTDTPKDLTPATVTPPELVNKLERLGKIGQQETQLPHVHAEPAEYYGGAQVWSRARTFSNVRFLRGDELTPGRPQTPTDEDGR
jgi:alpha,alpha-trehalase